jgi:predicted DNA-binding transcriptional regulator AlpA
MNATSDRRLDKLLSPKEVIEYLRQRYGIVISVATFYTMKSRGQGPKVTYFRNRAKYIGNDIDEWVARNISSARSSM